MCRSRMTPERRRWNNYNMEIKTSPQTKSLSCVQINLRHSRVATAELSRRKYNVVLIQEPYLYKNRVSLGGRVYSCSTEKPRACILSDLNVFQADNFTNGDMCTVVTKLDNHVVYLVSLYLDITLPTIPEMLKDIVRHCNSQGFPLIIGGDVNAHSPMWGCPEANSIVNDFEEFINEEDLVVLNQGSTPTFSSPVGESIIDITITNQKAFNLMQIKEWQVEKEGSSSDHRYITYKIKVRDRETRLVRNLKKVDWLDFTSRIIEAWKVEPPPVIQTDGSNLEACAEALEDSINKTLDLICPKKAVKMGKSPKWWNKDLERLRKCVLYLKNRANSAMYQRAHKDALNRYKNAIIKAKRQSWRDFCSKAESSKEVSDLVKICKGKQGPTAVSLLKRNGVVVNTPQEALQVLMDKHFPESIPADDGLDEGEDEHIVQEFDEYITLDKVKAAISSLGPQKAAGPDGFKPIILQKLPEACLIYLTEIYRMSVIMGTVPLIWRKMKVVFLPKAGKDDYTDPKAYRRITLSNHLLKALERLILCFINEKIVTEPLHAQHAYTKEFSCDTALSEVVDHI